MKRQVYLFKKMRKLSMFITAVCVLFLGGITLETSHRAKLRSETSEKTCFKSIYLFHQKKEKEKTKI